MKPKMYLFIFCLNAKHDVWQEIKTAHSHCEIYWKQQRAVGMFFSSTARKLVRVNGKKQDTDARH